MSSLFVSTAAPASPSCLRVRALEAARNPSPSPPPPSPMGDDAPPNIFSPIFITLLCFMGAALVLTIYHCLVVSRCPQGQPGVAPPGPGPDYGASPGGEELSSARLVLPAGTYGNGEGMVDGGEGTCPVCLCDFKDGDQVRLLPECMHCYHVPCIDKWLLTHSSCPMCRADATPPPGRGAVSGRTAPDSGGTRV